MTHTDFILDENFIDMVFRHMYDKRGTFGSSSTITNAIAENNDRIIVYNDVLMALEQLERDAFLNLEKNM